MNSSSTRTSGNSMLKEWCHFLVLRNVEGIYMAKPSCAYQWRDQNLNHFMVKEKKPIWNPKLESSWGWEMYFINLSFCPSCIGLCRYLNLHLQLNSLAELHNRSPFSELKVFKQAKALVKTSLVFQSHKRRGRIAVSNAFEL